MSKYAKLTINTTTKKLLMEECKKLFLKAHPEFTGYKITENFMLLKVCEYYIK